VYFTNSGTADMPEIMLGKLNIQSWGLPPLTDASFLKLTGVCEGNSKLKLITRQSMANKKASFLVARTDTTSSVLEMGESLSVFPQGCIYTR